MPADGTTVKQRSRRLALHYLYVLPAVLMLVVFVAYPILWVISESLHGNGSAHPTAFVGLDHYWQLFQDSVFWRVLVNMFL